MSSGDGGVQFDHSYLLHDSVVTSLEWKGKRAEEHGGKSVLYTVCAEGKVKVWATIDPHALQSMQLWAEIDLQNSIQPRYLNLAAESRHRYVLFLDGADFERSIQAIQGAEAQSPVLQHLLEITQQEPDVCVVLDEHGHMCVWGMHNPGSKEPAASDMFNMVFVENVNLFTTITSPAQAAPHRLLGFCDLSSKSALSVLLHPFDGTISWFEGNFLDCFDPSRTQKRFHLKAAWTGHEGEIKKINRTSKGHAIVTQTAGNECLVWKQAKSQDRALLDRCSSFWSDQPIQRTCVLASGDFVATLHSNYINLWDARCFAAEQSVSCPFQLDGEPLCLILLPSADATSSRRFIAIISSSMRGIVWQAKLPQEGIIDGSSNGSEFALDQFSTFTLSPGTDLAYVLPVDPAGSVPIISGFLDTFAKDVALS